MTRPREVVPVAMTGARVLLAGAAGYALGCLPSADLATRLAGRDDVDLHRDGTGNPGGLNTSHVLGRGWGAGVTAADIGKAFVAGRLGLWLAGDRGATVAATAAVVGHCHPVGRTGGKGVASSIGHVASTFPAYLPIDLAVGAATAAAPWFRQRTRSATMVASTAWVTAAAVWWWRDLPNPWGVTPGPELLAGTTVSAVVIAERFHAEVARVEAYNAATCQGGGA